MKFDDNTHTFNVDGCPTVSINDMSEDALHDAIERAHDMGMPMVDMSAAVDPDDALVYERSAFTRYHD